MLRILSVIAIVIIIIIIFMIIIWKVAVRDPGLQAQHWHGAVPGDI